MTLSALATETPAACPPVLTVEDVYEAHVDFVARMARGLGVPASGIDDVVQDVFLVVHRKLADFEGRAQVKTWVAKIVVNVVRTHRRAHGKRRALDSFDDEVTIDTSGKTPDEIALEREAVKLLLEILEAMPEEQRTVFMLSEIEDLEMHEIAASLGINVNTAYSRLRLARRTYQRGVERAQAQRRWREP